MLTFAAPKLCPFGSNLGEGSLYKYNLEYYAVPPVTLRDLVLEEAYV